MSDLIDKYGKDYQAVGSHVRHPALTFMLLENYDRRIPRDLPHVDRITEAARLYLEEIESGKIEYIADHKKEVDRSVSDIFVEQLEPLVNYDEYGNVVYEDAEEEEEDMFNFQAYYADSDVVIDISQNKPEYVWEMGDNIVFDVQTFSKQVIDSLLSYVYQRQAPNGFYRVRIIYNDQLIDTKMRVEELDLEEVNAMLIKYAEGGVTADRSA